MHAGGGERERGREREREMHALSGMLRMSYKHSINNQRNSPSRHHSAHNVAGSRSYVKTQLNGFAGPSDQLTHKSWNLLSMARNRPLACLYLGATPGPMGQPQTNKGDPSLVDDTYS